MYLYVLKIRGFFFLCCVWINGFYSLLDSRLAYTSANLAQLLLPQYLLSAFCHRSVNGKNFSHDSCWSVVWVNELVSVSATVMDWCCALYFYFFVPWHPKDQKTDTSGFVHVKFWTFKVCSVLRCCKRARFHFLWHCITAEGKVCFCCAPSFHWSQAWNMYGLANLQSSCLWIAVWVRHICTT